MKTGKAEIVSFQVQCPECGGSLVAPCGSTNFDIHSHNDKTAECTDCGKTSKLPAKIPGRKIEK